MAGGARSPGPSWTVLPELSPSLALSDGTDELTISSQEMDDTQQSVHQDTIRKRKPNTSGSDELIKKDVQVKRVRISGDSRGRVGGEVDGDGASSHTRPSLIQDANLSLVRTPGANTGGKSVPLLPFSLRGVLPTEERGYPIQIARKRPPRKKPVPRQFLNESDSESSPSENAPIASQPALRQKDSTLMPPPASQPTSLARKPGDPPLSSRKPRRAQSASSSGDSNDEINFLNPPIKRREWPHASGSPSWHPPIGNPPLTPFRSFASKQTLNKLPATQPASVSSASLKRPRPTPRTVSAPFPTSQPIASSSKMMMPPLERAKARKSAARSDFETSSEELPVDALAIMRQADVERKSKSPAKAPLSVSRLMEASAQDGDSDSSAASNGEYYSSKKKKKRKLLPVHVSTLRSVQPEGSSATQPRRKSFGSFASEAVFSISAKAVATAGKQSSALADRPPALTQPVSNKIRPPASQARRKSDASIPEKRPVPQPRREPPSSSIEILSGDSTPASTQKPSTRGKRPRKSALIVPDNGVISLTDTDGEEAKKSAKKPPPPQFKCDADGTIIIDSDTDEEQGADVMLPSAAISSPVCVPKQRGSNEIPRSAALLQHEEPIPNDQAEDVLMSTEDGPHELRSSPVEMSTLTRLEETFSPPPPSPEPSIIEDQMQTLDLCADEGNEIPGQAEGRHDSVPTPNGQDVPAISGQDLPSPRVSCEREDAELASSVDIQLQISNTDSSVVHLAGSPDQPSHLEMQNDMLVTEARASQTRELIISATENTIAPVSKSSEELVQENTRTAMSATTDDHAVQAAQVAKSPVGSQWWGKSPSSLTRMLPLAYSGPDGCFKGFYDFRSRKHASSSKILKPGESREGGHFARSKCEGMPPTFNTDEMEKRLPELAYPPSATQSSDSGTADEAEGSATAVAQEVKTVTPENALESGIPPGTMQVDEPESPTASISPGVEMATDELVNCPSSQAGEPRKAPTHDIVPEIVPTEDSSVSISQSAIASRPAQSLAATQHSSPVESTAKVEPQGLSLTELLNQVYRDAQLNKKTDDATSTPVQSQRPGAGSSSNDPILIDFDEEETVPVQAEVHSTVEQRGHSNDENLVNPPCDASSNGMTDNARIVYSSVNADEPPGSISSLWPANGVPSRSKSPRNLGSTRGSRRPHNSSPPVEPVPARFADATRPRPTASFVEQDVVRYAVRGQEPTSHILAAEISASAIEPVPARFADVIRPRPTASSVEPDIIRDEDLVMQGQQSTSHSLAVEIFAPIAFLTASEVLGGQPDEDVLDVPERASGVDTPESDVSRAPSPGMHPPPSSPSEDEDEEEEQEIAWYLHESEASDQQSNPASPTIAKRVLRPRSAASNAVMSLRASARQSSASSGSSAGGPVTPVNDVLSAEPRITTPNRYTPDSELSALALTAQKSGFRMMTWEQHREQLAKEYAHPPVLAKDLPHELEDRINYLPRYARRADNMQVKLFEAAIAENTETDEPHAPPIHIINDIDDDLTPPYEFHYSNLMWHGEGVPKPDWENLRGCDCIGPCDPKSETCICAQRHRQHFESPGFLYDERGRLTSQGYPIFECNDLCRCSDDCINRVVQRGRKYPINICKTEDKGWGVFAGHKRIPANTYIGIYAGEYLTESEAEERGVLYNKFGRTYLFDVDFWHLRVDDPNWTSKYSIDAYHAGNFTRYLNHSCDPNCSINAVYINEANIDKPLLAIFTTRDVRPGDELCFSYYGEDDDSDEDAPKSPHESICMPNDAVYRECRCGAAKCTGNMWR